MESIPHSMESIHHSMESIPHSMESTPHSMDSTWNNPGRVKYCWEAVLSVKGKGTESKFAALGAGKGGTAAAGGREGSQVEQISKGTVPAAFDKCGSNTLFAGPHFISPSGIFPFGHHTTPRSFVHCGPLHWQGHS